MLTTSAHNNATAHNINSKNSSKPVAQPHNKKEVIFGKKTILTLVDQFSVAR